MVAVLVASAVVVITSVLVESVVVLVTTVHLGITTVLVGVTVVLIRVVYVTVTVGRTSVEVMRLVGTCLTDFVPCTVRHDCFVLILVEASSTPASTVVRSVGTMRRVERCMIADDGVRYFKTLQDAPSDNERGLWDTLMYVLTAVSDFLVLHADLFESKLSGGFFKPAVIVLVAGSGSLFHWP
jgi:hypothetical protein